MSLAKTSRGATVRITAVHCDHPVTYRLMEMGLIEGAEVTVLGRAPLGDPLRIRVGDSELSLRHTLASCVSVSA